MKETSVPPRLNNLKPLVVLFVFANCELSTCVISQQSYIYEPSVLSKECSDWRIYTLPRGYFRLFCLALRFLVYPLLATLLLLHHSRSLFTPSQLPDIQDYLTIFLRHECATRQEVVAVPIPFLLWFASRRECPSLDIFTKKPRSGLSFKRAKTFRCTSLSFFFVNLEKNFFCFFYSFWSFINI